MLTRRIIPCLDVRAGRVVKGVNFVNIRDAGDPVEVARRYDEQGADELVFLDITASHENRQIIFDVVRQVADQCFMPFTVGGGIRTIDDVTRLIQAGAEKVSINTAAVDNPPIVEQTARRFGQCATVVNIDPKRVDRKTFVERAGHEPQGPLSDDGRVFEVHTHGGRTATGLEAVPWARRVCEMGAGEIVLTSMDADGTRHGYDLELTRAVVEAVNVPLVASGGCGSPQHMAEALAATDQGGSGASAALAASIFHYNEYTVAQAKAFCADRGIPVRLIKDHAA
ncbi:MAG: imidazole glycerol phosphate synthase subunit HisF [Planctomycetes bacterium]|jgi:cyclase|nr:imidazole glycerol phosphate synthase subunit HisF [Planctomycetota bacterium]